MAGAKFQYSIGSSADGTFYTIPSAYTPSLEWHEVDVSHDSKNTASHLLWMEGGTDYTNVAEIEFLRSENGLVKATGTLSGSDNHRTFPNTAYTSVYDGWTNTFFDGNSADGYAVMKLGKPRVLKAVRIYPRSSQPGRLVNAKIQGSMTGTSGSYVDLLTITSEPRVGWNTYQINNNTAYRYYSIFGGTDFTNVAEVEYMVEPVNIGLNKTVTASNTSSGQTSNLVDGNTDTTWSSKSVDDVNLVLDLGSSKTINEVRVSWGAEYAKSYKVQTSNDNINWTTRRLVFETGKPDVDVTDFSGAVSARYVRIQADVPSTSNGYKIREIKVLQY